MPGAFYSSPDIYALEKERVFMKDWLCVARSEEIGNPGDFITLRIMEEPIVVARAKDGGLNAFANVCRHRGVEVAVGAGNTEEFHCPYHGWLYDLEGRLVGAPYMKEAEGFDPKTCRLTPIGLDVWQGWVFVNFDPDCPPLSAFVAAFEEDFGLYRFGELRLAARIQFDFDCNWKLVVENAMDNYHINTLHKDTLGVGVDTREENIDLRPDGGYRMFYDHTPRNDGPHLVRPQDLLARPGTGNPCRRRLPGAQLPDLHLRRQRRGSDLLADGHRPMPLLRPYPVPAGVLRPARLRRADRRLRQPGDPDH